MLKVKFKKLHPSARLMDCAKFGDAGHDIGFVNESQKGELSGSIDEYGNLCYYTGISIEMPEINLPFMRMQCFAFLKSSFSKKSLTLTNGVGLIDFGYRGEITFKLKPAFSFEDIADFTEISFISTRKKFLEGEFIGQLVFIPVFDIELEEVIVLSESERGVMGFGEATNERVL